MSGKRGSWFDRLTTSVYRHIVLDTLGRREMIQRRQCVELFIDQSTIQRRQGLGARDAPSHLTGQLEQVLSAVNGVSGVERTAVVSQHPVHGAVARRDEK